MRNEEFYISLRQLQAFINNNLYCANESQQEILLICMEQMIEQVREKGTFVDISNFYKESFDKPKSLFTVGDND